MLSLPEKERLSAFLKVIVLMVAIAGILKDAFPCFFLDVSAVIGAEAEDTSYSVSPAIILIATAPKQFCTKKVQRIKSKNSFFI